MNPMRRSTVALCVLLLVIGWTKAAQAQATVLTVSGSPGAFTVSTAVAGSQPLGLSNSSTTYFVRVRNSEGVKKIIAQLNSPMPVGTSLTLAMAAPPGASSLGAVSLDATGRDIVVNIEKENGVTLGVTYAFTATVAAGVVPVQSRTVTLTLVNFP